MDDVALVDISPSRTNKRRRSRLNSARRTLYAIPFGVAAITYDIRTRAKTLNSLILRIHILFSEKADSAAELHNGRFGASKRVVFIALGFFLVLCS
jgi:hypothetical protein